MEIIKNFRGIDFLTLLLFLRIIYTSLKSGLVAEIIKMIGIFLASFFSLQFYPIFLRRFKDVLSNPGYLDFFSIIVIFCGVSTAFFILVKIFITLAKEREIFLWERIISLCVGLARASLLVSLFIFAFSFLPEGENPYKESISGRFFKKVAPYAYVYTFEFFKKINPAFKFNKEVKEVL